MLEHHDDLTREFPDLKQVVLQLQAKDASFATLLATYRELDKRIYQAESSVEPVGDQTLETWKVEPKPSDFQPRRYQPCRPASRR